MPSLAILLLVFLVVVCVLPTGAYAFGAGDIPDFSYLNDKAFRHGDIENILVELAKQGAKSGGGGLLGFAQSVLSAASGGKKFSKEDVKKVYFGNWLRDYSQCMDIAGLSALTADTLVMVVGVLGFLAFGFATEEFQVTADRLGVYLPVEHIDNPKGYAEKEGDARKFHPKLRGPVDNRELEIDEGNGMKKYIATENQGWDTSSAFIRRSLKAAIDHGRKANGNENADLWEAYRLLGQSLHTLEDLLAHSNWCELALRKLGHDQVFPHVGDNVKVNTPNGQAPPLVTGTFGSADFYHSLIGETADHLSQTSVTDLSQKMNEAKNQDQEQALGLLKTILGKVMSTGGSSQDDKAQQADTLKDKSQAYNFDPNNVMPPEVQTQLWELLKWRDSIMRDVIRQLAMVPGLSDLIDSLTDALNAYVYTLLAPYLAPVLEQLTSVLHAGGEGVINTEDQYEVFTNSDASDPSHSQLSKDHFALILNEPAGKVARIVVQNSVNLVVEAWTDHGKNDDEVVNHILEAFFHPYYATGNSQIQNAMLKELESWLNGLDDKETTLQNLTKEAVKDHKNVRLSDEQVQEVSSAQGAGSQYQHSSGGGTYAQGGYGGVGREHGSSGGQGGHSGGHAGQSGGYGSQSGGYGSQSGGYGSQSGGQSGGYGSQSGGYGSQSGGYGSQSGGYGSQSGGYGQSEQPSSGYGQSEQPSSGYSGGGYGREQESSYGRSEESGGFHRSEGGYGSQTQESSGYKPSYQQSSETSGYGGDSGGYRSRPQEETSGYGGGESGGYGQTSGGYGGDSGGYSSRRQEETTSYGGDSGGYGGDSGGHSSRRHGGDSGGDSGGYGGDSGGYGGDSGGHHGSRRHQGGEDETFGAERLNISDESEGRERRRHHGGDSGGYGGDSGGYGGDSGGSGGYGRSGY